MDNKDLSLEKMMETEILLYSSIIQEWNLAPILKGSSDIGVLPTLSSRSEIVSWCPLSSKKAKDATEHHDDDVRGFGTSSITSCWILDANEL
jgi:hypothetical protein